MLLIVDGIESRCYRMVMYAVKATVEYLFVGLIIYAFTVRYELRGTEGINLLIQDYLISFAPPRGSNHALVTVAMGVS